MNKKQQQQKQASAPSSKAIKNAKARARKKERKKLLGARGLNPGYSQRDSRFALNWNGGGIDTPWGSANIGNLGFVTDSYAEISNKRSQGRRNPSMVGLGERTDDIQVILPRIAPGLNAKGMAVDVCYGTEFLSSITNPFAGSSPGDILAALLINPSNFPQTRLIEFAKLYQRYRFRKLNFWYKPTANSIQSGQLIGYGDYDPDNILTQNDPDNIGVAAAHIGQATGKIWESICFPFGVLDDYTTLFVDTNSPEKRLAFQGVFYMLAASDIENTIGPLGNLYIEYEVEFSIPLLQSFTPSASIAVIDSGSSGRLLSKPFGTTPVASTAVAYLPNAAFKFSLTDSTSDLYFDYSTNALGIMHNNVTEEGDLWLHQVSMLLSDTSVVSWAGTVLGGLAPVMTYTGCLAAALDTPVNQGLNKWKPGTTVNVTDTEINLSVTNILKCTGGPVTAKFDPGASAYAGGVSTPVGFARQTWLRLSRGPVQPSFDAGIPERYSLTHLRKGETVKRLHRKQAHDSAASVDKSGISLPDYQEFLRFFQFQSQLKQMAEEQESEEEGEEFDTPPSKSGKGKSRSPSKEK